MIFLPESIERTLERIGDAYKRKIKNGKKDKENNTVKTQLEYFEKFKASLENGTNQLLICEEGKRR